MELTLSSRARHLLQIRTIGPHVDHPSGHGHGGLSDARVIRLGPTTADVYIDISPFYGMAADSMHARNNNSLPENPADGEHRC